MRPSQPRGMQQEATGGGPGPYESLGLGMNNPRQISQLYVCFFFMALKSSNLLGIVNEGAYPLPSRNEKAARPNGWDGRLLATFIGGQARCGRA